MRKHQSWMLAAGLLAAIILPNWAQAASITVDGSTCTLDNAITSANNNADTGGCIGSGTYGDDTVTLQTDVTLSAFLPQITSKMTIEGGGHFISGNNKYHVLYIASSGDLTLNQTTVKEGHTSVFGGGIYNDGIVTLTNSTVSGNTTSSSSFGGGIFNDGIVTLTNSTVSGNTANHGGGIYNTSGTTVTLQSSIISGNTASSGGNEMQNAGTVIADSYNVFGHSGETNAQAFSGFTPTGTDVNAASDGANVALASILSPIADNGGPTQTHALVAGSPAIDLDASCSTGLTTDQRGYGIRPVGAGCDAGAFEYGAVPVFIVTPNAGTGGSVTPDTALAVNEGDTASFTVTPDAGYTKDAKVSGTCPEGSWASSTYTTGQIDADCTVEFSFKKINMVPVYKLLLLK